ncbi:PAS domain S-box protein [Caenimonas terrae]|uniref:histidine kinase n=1 Tax=Caenimonas terrae TaxID=696074 RepID=A0ABW0ND31_9BURK
MEPKVIEDRRNPGLEERLQLLIEAVVDYGIFVLDPQGHVVSWNTGAQKLKGYTRDEIVGKHFSTFYPREEVERGWPQEELRRALASGRFEDEGWRIRKDGSRFWANVVITPLYESGGELAGFAKITRDLTDRRENEQRLRASEERLRLLIESVRDYAIFMLDPDGTVRGWNTGAQTIKGYTADEIIGQHFSKFYTPDDQRAGKPARELETALAVGSLEDEGWRVRKDGTLFWANVVITAVRDTSGRLIGFAKVTRDMTERKRLEELERSSRRMSEFLAMLAHELRNPLAPIRNAVTVMQLETMASPALRNSRDIIDRQLTHMTRLVDELLDVGRLTTGKVKLRREKVDFGGVIARSVEMARPLIEARGHQLNVDLPPIGVFVNGDGTRLTQILQNLLVNAAKYTPDGGRIRLQVQAADGFVDTRVIDSGRGIEPDELERIFELFMQGDTSNAPNESGLGIGLTLARSLALLHGGTLEATSGGSGRGSTFMLRLPLGELQEDLPDEGVPGQPAPGALRVMVVDDNRDSADSATSIVRLLGFRVETAYNGAAALDLARTLRPHAVLLDLSMPQIDGYETLKLLRVQPGMENAYVIAMTGFGSDEDRRRTRAAGFDAHLVKPVGLDLLVGVLNEARERHEAAGP